MSNQLYGLVWYTAYEDYEILAIYQKKEVAEFHCKALRDGMRKAGIEDEELRVAPVMADNEGWVQEIR